MGIWVCVCIQRLYNGLDITELQNEFTTCVYDFTIPIL
jgi:hypothetical protein